MSLLLYRTQTRWMFHADIKLKFSVFLGDELFDQLFGIMNDVDRFYNSYSEQSFIHKININAGNYVEVDDETICLLKKVACISDHFKGEFDITVMPIIRLWGFYKDSELSIPTDSEIKKTKKLVNYKKIKFKQNKVRIAKEQEIITGSFIKAYATDKMIVQMQEMGMTDAIVNAGGSTIKAITDENHPHWEVLVKQLDNEQELFRLKLANKCFSTSAQGKTFVEIEGKRYGHIVNPRTGYPSTNKQVGIISDDCLSGDIISTALFNLTGKEFVKKMKSLAKEFGVEGYLIDEENKIHLSENFEQYII